MSNIAGNEQRLVDAWTRRLNHYRKFLDIVAVVANCCPNLPLPDVHLGHLEWRTSSFSVGERDQLADLIGSIHIDGPPNHPSTITRIRFRVSLPSSDCAWSCSVSDPVDLSSRAAEFEQMLLIEARRRGLIQ